MTMNLTVILQMLQPEQPPTLASHSPQPHLNPETTPVLTAPQDLLISKKPLNDDPQIHFTQPIIQDQGKPLYFRGWVNLTDVDVNM